MLCEVDRESGEVVASTCRSASPDPAPTSQITRRATLVQMRPVHRVYACPPKVCLEWKEGSNGTTNSNCKTGHEGVVCATCAPGWGMTKGVCKRCRNGSERRQQQAGISWPAVVVMIIVATVLLVLWYILAWRPLILHHFPWEEKCLACGLGVLAFPFISQIANLVKYLWQSLSRRANRQAGMDSAHLRSLFKILAGFLQVVGSFFSSFRIEWPPLFETLMDIATIFQLDPFSLPTAACLLDVTYFQQLIVKTTMPLVVVALLALPSLIAVVLGACFFGGVRNYPNLKEITAKFESSVLLFLFLVYPSLSQTVMRALKCRTYGADGSLLEADHRVDCNSPEYLESIFIWALCCFFLYPVGIPVFCYLQMRFAGLPELLAAKEAEARFTSFLNLRRRQLSTMPRAICAQAMGNTHLDEDEFERRLQLLYDKHLAHLFKPWDRTSSLIDSSKGVFGKGDGGEGEGGAGGGGGAGRGCDGGVGGGGGRSQGDRGIMTMRPDDLINAVALLGDIPPDHVPMGDIQDLIKR